MAATAPGQDLSDHVTAFFNSFDRSTLTVLSEHVKAFREVLLSEKNPGESWSSEEERSLASLAQSWMGSLQTTRKGPVALPGGSTHWWCRPMLCLSCVFIGTICDQSVSRHTESTKHALYYDFKYDEVYCEESNDFVFDPRLECLFKNKRRCLSSAMESGVIMGMTTPGNAMDGTSVGHVAVNPSSSAAGQKTPTKDVSVMTQSSWHPVTGRLVGMRGLNNFGNTCFMNSVLQALIHNPMLHKFFLAEQHMPSQCASRRRRNREDLYRKLKASGQETSANELAQSGDDCCMACELDILVNHFYNGTKDPLSPSRFLMGLWKCTSSSSLAGYEQQDAHECLISTLNLIHSHCKASKGPVAREECDCIIHQAFSGVLRSDLTCSSCGNTSVTRDPMFDLSLDVKGTEVASGTPPTTSNSSPAIAGKAGPDVPHAETLSVYDCLRRFTHKEVLGDGDSMLCNACKKRCTFSKQFSVEVLPNVLCLHLKRFEHTHEGNANGGPAFRKVERFVGFPCMSPLDMSPCASTAVLNTAEGEQVWPQWSIDIDTQFESAVDWALDADPSGATTLAGSSGKGSGDGTELYDLFAVVTHIGTMDNGHYVCYVKHNDAWYLCDDAQIRPCPSHTVASAEAYILFYARKQVQFSQGGFTAPFETNTVSSPTAPQKMK